MIIKQKVKTGLDLLFNSHLSLLQKASIGILCHPASVNASTKHILELFKENKSIHLVKLFGPEHGVWGTAQDMEGLNTSRDHLTNLPTVSLYGNDVDSLKPKPANLKDIDLLVVDLQDIGSRYYTFIYTMAFCLEACAAQNIKVIVLDRPNPINGTTIEGPLLCDGFESFVGIYPLPIRHGMTIGELALYFNTEFNINCELEVIAMDGWQRDYLFDDTGLPWVYPSPNMPTLEAALVYPGLCLIEATELSEGRGTTKPFELVGAPYIHPWTLASELQKLKMPGVLFRPCYFKPTFQKWAHQDCGGVQIHITNRQELKPVELGARLIQTIKNIYPNDFKWRSKPYEFVKDIPAIDLLWGASDLRNAIESGQTLNPIFQQAESECHLFNENRKKYFLY